MQADRRAESAKVYGFLDRLWLHEDRGSSLDRRIGQRFVFGSVLRRSNERANPDHAEKKLLEGNVVRRPHLAKAAREQ